MILDSNIIIYSIEPTAQNLKSLIAKYKPSFSAVSQVEALGFHRITAQDKADLETLFTKLTALPVTQDVIDAATKLRQQKKMSLGDAIIAATCLVHNQALVTRNTADFSWTPD